jgi:hypothetical protein
MITNHEIMTHLKIILSLAFLTLLSSYSFAQDDAITTKQGFIILKVSAEKIFLGGTITISGESGQMKTIKTIAIKITGPKTNINKSVNLKDGKYEVKWLADTATGTFNISATSSDGKATEDKKIEVYSINKIETMANEDITQTNDALQKVKEAKDKVKILLSTNDADELEKKFTKFVENVNQLQALHTTINSANKEIAKQINSGKNYPGYFYDNLSTLNNQLHEDAERMKQINNFNKHKPYGFTICEALVVLNETAAAFSTASNIAAGGWPTLLIKIAENIAIDKATSAGVDYVSPKGNGVVKNIGVDAGLEIEKIYLTCKSSGDKLSKTLVANKGGIAGDLIAFATDILLKKYCVNFEGAVASEHRCYNRNNKSEDWWDYGYKTQAKICLRYPKAGNEGNIVKMIGNIEGNATLFSFMQNINNEDDFTKELKGRNAGRLFIEIKPPCLPFCTALNDKLGFGMAARVIATPAYFNIPINAEYNRNTGIIKLFLQEPPPLCDFTPLIKTQVLFFDFVPFPLVTYQAFPYEKVFISMNAVVKRSKGYKMTKDANGNLLFVNKDGFHVGSKNETLEIDVKLDIAAKQQ